MTSIPQTFRRPFSIKIKPTTTILQVLHRIISTMKPPTTSTQQTSQRYLAVTLLLVTLHKISLRLRETDLRLLIIRSRSSITSHMAKNPSSICHTTFLPIARLTRICISNLTRVFRTAVFPQSHPTTLTIKAPMLPSLLLPNQLLQRQATSLPPSSSQVSAGMDPSQKHPLPLLR